MFSGKILFQQELYSAIGGGPISTDTGWVLPTDATNYGVGDTWSNPTNVTILGTGTLASSFPQSTFTKSLFARTFDFSEIPDGATIDGIEARANRRSAENTSQDIEFQLFISGTPSGDNKATSTFAPISFTNLTYGGASDLWGLTPSASDVKNTNFGFGYRAEEIDDTSDTVQVASMEMKIYYTYTP